MDGATRPKMTEEEDEESDDDDDKDYIATNRRQFVDF